MARPGKWVNTVGLTQRHGSAERAARRLQQEEDIKHNSPAMLKLARKMANVSVSPAKTLSQSSYLVTGTVPPNHAPTRCASASSRSPQES